MPASYFAQHSDRIVARQSSFAQPTRDAHPDYDVTGLARIVWRRRVTVLIATLGGLIIAAALIPLTTRQYQASAELQLMKEQSSLSAERLGGDGDAAASDALDFNMTLQTYVNILSSDMLALRVIQELGIDKTHDYKYTKHAGGYSPSDSPLPGELNVSPEQRDWLLKRFHKNLAVDALPGTRIIKIGFRNSDPALASRVANQLVSDFVAYNFEVQDATVLGPSGVLGQELAGLKQQVEEAETKTATLQRQSGGFGLSGGYNALLSQLQDLNHAAMDAESNRVMKQAIYDAARSGNPELISSLASSGDGQAGGFGLVQQLREEQDKVQAEYSEDSARYGENYPKLAQLNQRLISLNASIGQEVAKLGERAKNDYLIAQQQETTVKSDLNAQKSVASDANDSAIQYLMAKDDADTDRQLYTQLSEKLHQAQLVARLHSKSINVFDPARVPSVPASPNVPILLGGGLAGGLFFGFIGAFAADGRDTRIRNIDEAEKISGFRLLGVIPEFPSNPNLREGKASVLNLPLGDGTSSFALPMVASSVSEAYRAVRTSIMATDPETPGARIYMVTSAMTAEGKSTTSLNLASVFARTGATTLVIDADLRSGVLGAKLGVPTARGLSDILLDGAPCGDSIQPVPNIGNLYVMQSGKRTASPSELLISARFSSMLSELRSSYDYIFVDTPPCIPVTDAVAVVQQVDGFIFVVRSESTTRQALAQSVRRFEQVGTPCLGIIMNAVNPNSSDYADYGGYGFPAAHVELKEVA